MKEEAATTETLAIDSPFVVAKEEAVDAVNNDDNTNIISVAVVVVVVLAAAVGAV